MHRDLLLPLAVGGLAIVFAVVGTQGNWPQNLTNGLVLAAIAVSTALRMTMHDYHAGSR